MKIRVYADLGLIEITPESKEEEKSLRSAWIYEREKLDVVYWGDTLPSKTGLKIWWKKRREDKK